MGNIYASFLGYNGYIWIRVSFVFWICKSKTWLLLLGIILPVLYLMYSVADPQTQIHQFMARSDFQSIKYKPLIV